jgi:hypothetical protein
MSMDHLLDVIDMKTRVRRKTSPSAFSSITNPTWIFAFFSG